MEYGYRIGGEGMKTKRIKTYVKGLDEVMQDGIPEGSVVMIAGKPGTMKSSFAFNILYHNANRKIVQEFMLHWSRAGPACWQTWPGWA